MSQLNAFLAFKPSFVSLGIGWPPKLFEEAFREAVTKLQPLLDKGERTVSVDGVVGEGETRWLLFGAIVSGGHATSSELDGAAPYSMTVTFDSADEISLITLTLFLLNPRFILAESAFFPAEYKENAFFAELTPAPAKCGVMLIAEPSGTAEERRAALVDGLPNTVVDAFPTAADPAMPVARLDLSTVWKADDLGKKSADLLGRYVGIPDVALPSKVSVTSLRLFCPDVEDNFAALLGASKTYALRLKEDAAESMLIIMHPPANTAPKPERDLFDKALAEFNLSNDFKGFLFNGIEAHWLDDTQHGHPNIPVPEIDLTAVSFGGGESGWYTSFGAKVTAPGNDGYLHLLRDARLSVTLVDGKISTYRLSGSFVDGLAWPWAWLAGRAASFSLRPDSWQDNVGATHQGATVELALEATEGNVLATLNKDSPVPMTEEQFSGVAVAMTLAPITVAFKPIQVPDRVHPPDDKSRGYYVPIGGPTRMAQIFSAAVLGLGWFFTKAVKIGELRVVGIRLQRQPIAVNDPSVSPEAYETAILFDYEVDYRIDIEDTKIKTARPMTARIDGTGLSISDSGDCAWVQVPAGVRELSIADPSLWDLGVLGKFLRITEITIRKTPTSQIAIHLHLNGNTDIVTTSDFVISVPLEGDVKPKIDSFPSKVSIGAPGSLQATGTLAINGEDIAGSLELILAGGLRMYGAVGVRPVPDAVGNSATATIFSAEVDFATLIPLFSTGLGLRGIEGIFATHMKRVEPAQSGAVPPALGWLKSVNGVVVTSVTEHPKAWTVEFDKSTTGFGIVMEPLSGGTLFSLNTILAIEPPGPRILLLVRFRMLEPPKDNKTAAKELDQGAIGVVDLDFGRRTATAALLAEAKFNSLVEVRAPIEAFFKMDRLSDWHLYIGRFDDRVSAKLKFMELLGISASFYFMASGEMIRGVPSDGPPRDLPGFALALGLEASIKIGPDFLYVAGGISFYFNVSLSDTLYVEGISVITGELRLFIVTVGATGRLTIRYIRKADSTDSIFISGSICGRYKDWFIDIAGCLELHLNSKIDEILPLSALPESVRIVAGADVSLRGQGILGPIDAVVGVAVPLGDPRPAPTAIPLDAVLAIAMAVPPRISDQAKGFAASAPALNQNETRFHVGAQLSEYLLKNVSLTRLAGGSIEEVDSSRYPARWWHSGLSDKGNQVMPVTLALLTRDPLSVKNALASADQMRRWLESIVAGLCYPAVKPQPCLYLLGVTDFGVPNGGKWIVSAMLRDAAIEQEIGVTGAAVSTITLLERPRAGTTADPLPGFPAFPGQCVVEDDPQGIGKIAFLRLYARLVLNGEGARVLARVSVAAEMLADAPIEFLVAYSETVRPQDLIFTVTTSIGAAHQQSIGQLEAGGDVQDLSLLDVQAAFHENAGNWKEPTERFFRLASMPAYSDLLFRRIVIDLAGLALSQGEVPNLLSIGFNGDLDVSTPLALLIGGHKFVPLAEKERWTRDKAYKDGQIAALKDYLVAEPIPLLERDSDYQVRIEWDEIAWDDVGGKKVTSPPPATFSFKTTAEPPRSAAPYLFATFPDAEEKFHSSNDKPGFALGSEDALRILAKFPHVRLKITISESGGAEVWDKTHALRWDTGRIYDPARIIDPLHPSPAGIEKDSIASLPSKLREAMQKLIDNGGLSCLGPVSIADSGLWIGLDVAFRALTAYLVRIEIVSEDGSPWHWTTPQPHDEPFLQWSFSTALHQDLKAYVANLSTLRPRHRILRSMLDLSRAVDGQLADKLFEDALANAIGERSDRSGEAQLTVLWEVPDIPDNSDFKAHALLIESREPLRRFTRSVKVGEPGSAGLGVDVQVAESALLPLQGVAFSPNGRIKRLTFSSSGCSCLAELDPDSTADLVLNFERYPVNRIPSTLAATEALTLTAVNLSPRTNRKI